MQSLWWAQDSASPCCSFFAAVRSLLGASSSSARACAACLNALCRSFDAFAPAVAIVGERVTKKPRAIGGVCTLLGGAAVVTFALVLIIQRANNNVNSSSAILLLSVDNAAAAASLPIASDSAWGSGIQVRITASCNAGALAEAPPWKASEASDAWTLAPPTPCSRDGFAPNTWQLVFRCPICAKLAATSSLSISLPYSCQSLLLEAAALDAAGSVSAYSTVAAAPPGSLLQSIVWTLPTLVAVLNSSVPTASSARGFSMTRDAAVIATTPLASDQSVELAPTTSSVAIALNFQLATFFTQTVLTPRTSIAALIASIVGIVGVFGFFGTVLAAVDVVAPTAARVARISSSPSILLRPPSLKPELAARAPPHRGTNFAAVVVKPDASKLFRSAPPLLPASLIDDEWSGDDAPATLNPMMASSDSADGRSRPGSLAASHLRDVSQSRDSSASRAVTVRRLAPLSFLAPMSTHFSNRIVSRPSK